MNKVVVKGKVGSLPEDKSNTGKKITELSITVTEHCENPEDGKNVMMTQWFQIVAYDYLALYALNLAVGDLVTIEGRLQKQTNEYESKTAKQGIKIIVNNITLTLKTRISLKGE